MVFRLVCRSVREHDKGEPLRSFIALCAVLALGIGASSASAGGGNSANAKKCQKGGWMTLSSSGLPFANQAACTSTAAKGGVLTTSFLRITSGPCTLNAESYPFCLTISGAGLKPNQTSPDYDELNIEAMFDESFPFRFEAPALPGTSATGTIAPTVFLAFDGCGGHIEVGLAYLTAQNTQITATGLLDPPACPNPA